VVKHLIESRSVAHWKPTLTRKVLPSEIQTGHFGKWQRIRIGEEVDLPIIVKEIEEQKNRNLESGGENVLGDFKFSASETDDGFAVSWELKSGEHLYGLGERFNAFDLRGKRHVLQAADAIGSNSSFRSYKPVPFLLSSAGYGVFINTASRVLFDARGDRCLTVCRGPLDMWIVNGTPKEIITEYTDLTGRPPLIPKWALGLWISRCMYPSRKYIEQVVDAMREEEIPCDVVSLDPLWMKYRLFCLRDCMNFEWDEKRFPNPAEMIEQFAEKGIKICLWINPYIPLLLPIFREAKSKGYLVTRRGRPTLTKDGPSAVVDFSNDEAVNWYKGKTAALLKQGVKALKTDYGEAAPEDGDYKKYSKNYIHNLYPLLYNRAVYETFEELGEPGVLWARSAWAGSQRYPRLNRRAELFVVWFRLLEPRHRRFYGHAFERVIYPVGAVRSLCLQCEAAWNHSEGTLGVRQTGIGSFQTLCKIAIPADSISIYCFLYRLEDWLSRSAADGVRISG